jgi:hypothetical protein
MQQLSQILGSLAITEDKDIRRYIWGENFSSSRAYRAIVGHHQLHNAYQQLWKCLCQPKHKVFFWLLIKDRLSIRNILKRKNMHLQLCSVPSKHWRNMSTSLPTVPICKAMLEIDNHWHSSAWELSRDHWLFKRQIAFLVFYGSCHPHLLGHMDSKKRPNL